MFLSQRESWEMFFFVIDLVRDYDFLPNNIISIINGTRLQLEKYFKNFFISFCNYELGFTNI